MWGISNVVMCLLALLLSFISTRFYGNYDTYKAIKYTDPTNSSTVMKMLSVLNKDWFIEPQNTDVFKLMNNLRTDYQDKICTRQINDKPRRYDFVSLVNTGEGYSAKQSTAVAALRYVISIVLATERSVVVDSTRGIFHAAKEALLQSLSQLSSVITIEEVNVATAEHISAPLDAAPRQLTESMDTLWRRLESATASCGGDSYCRQIHFTVYFPNSPSAAGVARTSADSAALVPDRGSVVVLMDSPRADNESDSRDNQRRVVAAVIRRQRAHLRQLLHIPEVEFAGPVTQYVRTVAVAADGGVQSRYSVLLSCSDAQQPEGSSLLPRPLSPLESTGYMVEQIALLYREAAHALSVFRAVHIEANRLLPLDIVLGRDWLRQYIASVGSVDRFVATLTVCTKGLTVRRVIVVDSGPGDDHRSWQNTVKQLNEPRHPPSCQYEELTDLFAAVKEIHRAALQLTAKQGDAAAPLLSQSVLPLEQYFALFAPFWLPMLVPLIKAIKDA